MGLSIQPIHRWSLDNTLEDSFGDIGLAATGAVFDTVNKKLGPASIFYDGIDDYLNGGDTSDFKWMHGAEAANNFKFTVAMWVRLPTPEPDKLYTLFATQNLSTSGVGIALFFDDRSSVPRSRVLGMQITRGVAVFPVITTYSVDNVYPNDSNFHLVIFKYDQGLGSGNAIIKVDNSVVHTANKTANVPTTANSTNAMHLGMTGVSTFPMEGNQDEVLIFKGITTDVDDTFLWNDGKGRDLDLKDRSPRRLLLLLNRGKRK